MTRTIIGKFGTRLVVPVAPEPPRRFSGDRLYPRLIIISQEMNRAAAKLCDRNGHVVRSFFGTIGACEAKAQEWGRQQP